MSLAIPVAGQALADGSLLYSESFENKTTLSCSSANGARLERAIPGDAWSVSNGALHADTPEAEIIQYLLLCGLNIDDFDLRVTVSNVTPNDFDDRLQGVGIWFRPTNGVQNHPVEDGYSVWFTKPGDLHLFWNNPENNQWELRHAPQPVRFIDPALPLDDIFQGNASVQLRLLALGGTLRVWLDNIEDTDEPIMILPLVDLHNKGRLGLCTVNAGARFENLEVYTPPANATDELVYLQTPDGFARCGFFMEWGGAIVDYRADFESLGDLDLAPNMIDIWDNGREVTFQLLDSGVPEVRTVEGRRNPFGGPFNATQGGFGGPIYRGATMEYVEPLEGRNGLRMCTRPLNFSAPRGLTLQDVKTIPRDMKVEFEAEMMDDGTVWLTHTITNDGFGQPSGPLNRQWVFQDVFVAYGSSFINSIKTYQGPRPFRAEQAESVFSYAPGVPVLTEPTTNLEHAYILFNREARAGFAIGQVPVLPHPGMGTVLVRLDADSPDARFFFVDFSPWFALTPNVPRTVRGFITPGTSTQLRAKCYALLPHNTFVFRDGFGHQGWTLQESGLQPPVSNDALQVSMNDVNGRGLASIDYLQLVADTHSSVVVDASGPPLTLWYTRDGEEFQASQTGPGAIDLSNDADWRGIVTNLRLEAPADFNGTFGIERIEAVWDQRWDFNIDGHPEGWFPSTPGQERPLRVRDGALRLVTSRPWAAIDSAMGLNVRKHAADGVVALEARVRPRHGGRMVLHVKRERDEQIYTNNRWSWDFGEFAHGVDTVPGTWQTVRFDLDRLADGTMISWMRLVYTDAHSDEVDIDWIRFVTASSPTEGVAAPPPEVAAPALVGEATPGLPNARVVQLTSLGEQARALWPDISAEGRHVVYIEQHADQTQRLILLEPDRPDAAPRVLAESGTDGARFWGLPLLARDAGSVLVQTDRLLPDGPRLPHPELYRYDLTGATPAWQRITNAQQTGVRLLPAAHRAAASRDARRVLTVERDLTSNLFQLVRYDIDPEPVRHVLLLSNDAFGFGATALDGDGRRAAFTSVADWDFGNNTDRNVEVYFVDDVGLPFPIVQQLTGRGATDPPREDPLAIGWLRFDDAGRRLVFETSRRMDPTFRNFDTRGAKFVPHQLFDVEINDASGPLPPLQILDTFSTRFSGRPNLSDNGEHLFFVSSEDHMYFEPRRQRFLADEPYDATAERLNPDLLPQVFLWDIDSGPVQLTAATSSMDLWHAAPAGDARGCRVVYHAGGEVFLLATDDTPPLLSCPGDITLAPDANGEALVPDAASWVLLDGCAGGVVTQDPPAGTPVYREQPRTVLVEVVDAFGDGDACVFTVDVACFAWGDVNGDGVVGTVDAALILQYDAFLIDEFPCCPETRPDTPPRADVNDDGLLGTLDAAYILQYDAFLIDRLPADVNSDGYGPEGPACAGAP